MLKQNGGNMGDCGIGAYTSAGVRLEIFPPVAMHVPALVSPSVTQWGYPSGIWLGAVHKGREGEYRSVEVARRAQQVFNGEIGACLIS
jgi:hypothetical protein